MIVIDSDHLSILQQNRSPQLSRLLAAMDQSVDTDFATTAISLEEQMRGWLAAINRTREVIDQPRYYARLTGLIDFYSRWQVIPFDESAAEMFLAHRQAGVRIGTMDLKIAAICLSKNSLLLSANLRDFEQVPGLRVENWLK
ncbi:tRNA(fMet)-specific endonuclease VapC [Anatilimnocola aggregata]|uniref:tRNA(fMet)-specific endonuclease VapC n=1 Tax=Anatilimnocola aggregata TaxID=2528021 RepID=A0A517YIW5_9BACT|nr:type II toxin-antitoxin system VapC family toxin [Anatilimnocola aggregata]QDU30166.1 tRNA(fMet)-specific endonuclease VapC [Anatilimnocola aggregata]